MDKTSGSRKALFVFVWGVLLWGGGAALTITLLDWHQSGHFRPPLHVLAMFAIYMTLGVFPGLLMWHRLAALPGKKLSLWQTRVQTILFFVLMLGLLYASWVLWFKKP
jgi:hypothetical protein